MFGRRPDATLVTGLPTVRRFMPFISPRRNDSLVLYTQEVEAQAALYQRRRDVLVEGLRRLGWSVKSPQAGMFVWAKIPEPWATRMSTMDLGMHLLEAGDVAVSPGSGFGPAGEGYVRMALVENENRLRQAIRQMGRCLSEPALDSGQTG